ncbi:MAG: imidazole glycerol phosphate synthase cyclase subunit [Bacteroidetes bacterium]|nr:imidazole glycerol phosphate synthase cyclase subunit [Bacteroidota bacterium]
MLKKRIIPVILLRNGVIVQSRNFKRYQLLGTPTAAVQRLSNWASDELIYLDISPIPYYDLNRDDLNHESFNDIIDIIKLVSGKCFMPLTFGGGIRTIEDVRIRLKLGADKISLNTAAIESPELIKQCSEEFGKQCVVVSIDSKKNENGTYMVYKGGRTETNLNPFDWAKEIEKLGAGEILINSMNLDGSGLGFDLDLIENISNSINIPTIALGGAGNWDHFAEVLKTSASAVAAANIFQHTENSVYNCKKYLFEKDLNVRKPLELLNTSLNL